MAVGFCRRCGNRCDRMYCDRCTKDTWQVLKNRDPAKKCDRCGTRIPDTYVRCYGCSGRYR